MCLQQITGTSLKRAFVVLLFFFIGQITFAQNELDNSAMHPADWSEGSVLLNDGTELKGFLRYDERNGRLSFENEEDVRSLLAHHVLGFEFYDERLSAQRVFYSLECNHPSKKFKQKLFFEVIKDYRQFILLSKTGPVDIDQKAYTAGDNYGFGGLPVDNPRGVWGTSVTITQTETLYIYDTNGTVTPYLRIMEKDLDGVLIDRRSTENKILDDELLEKCVGPQYAQLKAYARENDLRFNSKRDLMKILAYYESLIE